MANDSSTGGPLLPDPPPQPTPAEGQALNQFLQQWLAGVSGLDGTMFRPRWQSEPPNIPDEGTAWAAFGITSRPSDKFPYIVHGGDDTGPWDEMQRHEYLNILVSCYDLGTNGQADMYLAQLRDGVAIPQNREVLELVGFNVTDCGDPIVVPSLLKKRWLYRADLPIRLRRCIIRHYPILDLESAQIAINVQDPNGSNVPMALSVVASVAPFAFGLGAFGVNPFGGGGVPTNPGFGFGTGAFGVNPFG